MLEMNANKAIYRYLESIGSLFTKNPNTRYIDTVANVEMSVSINSTLQRLM